MRDVADALADAHLPTDLADATAAVLQRWTQDKDIILPLHEILNQLRSPYDRLMRRSAEHHQATHSRTGAGSVRPARQPCMSKGQPKIVIGALTPTPSNVPKARPPHGMSERSRLR